VGMGSLDSGTECRLDRPYLPDLRIPVFPGIPAPLAAAGCPMCILVADCVVRTRMLRQCTRNFYVPSKRRQPKVVEVVLRS
jgi:hypothetical protein